jgi:hypothetical protein
MATNELRSSVVRAASKRQKLALAYRHEADSPKVAKESLSDLGLRAGDVRNGSDHDIGVRPETGHSPHGPKADLPNRRSGWSGDVGELS